MKSAEISDDTENDCACQDQPEEYFFRDAAVITGSDNISAGTVEGVQDEYGEQAQEIGIGSPGFPEAQMCQSIYHACHTASRTLISCIFIKPAGNAQAGEGDHKEVGKTCQQDFQP